MEEQRETLLDSLRRFGVSIPNGAASFAELLSTEALISICAQCLNLLDGSSSFALSLPESTEERFKVCTDISAFIKSMGFVGDLSFYEFLHPSEEDTYVLIRFLVERLSESFAVGKAADNTQSNKENLSHTKFDQKLRLKAKVSESSHTDPEDVDDRSIEKADNENGSPANLVRHEKQDQTEDELEILKNGNDSVEEAGEALELASGNLINPFAHQYSKMMRCNMEEVQHGGNGLDEVLKDRAELEHLENELELLKAATEIALAVDHPCDLYIETLKGDIVAKEKSLTDLELQGRAVRTTLEEKRRRLEESIYRSNRDVYEKFQRLKAVEKERGSILSETQKWEEEYSSLSAQQKQQSSRKSRRSYIEQIKEITKNSRKQDVDIEKIIGDTRELQLESNSIQERLYRTYAIADETVLREAKKDQVGRQAYRLLTSIHETFEQVCDKIMATDRVAREIAEHEKKIAEMASPSLDIDKLKSDLEAIIKENESLEQGLHGDFDN
ncbi:hypothetical protein SAY87_022136 [Trapa incisa]|uniref:Coiled-coil domain-containing protein 22 homolog n=1 Tax=Trapa incisa TaxID=236973 RepID=A0AAN7JY43_9MYRT|nr:hypothetical protein SAY87_022136 [Trapa incisa]